MENEETRMHHCDSKIFPWYTVKGETPYTDVWALSCILLLILDIHDTLVQRVMFAKIFSYIPM